MSRELIDIKQIDVSKLNDVKIYDVLPEEVEGQVAYYTGDGKLYYGDGSKWKEISGGGGLPTGAANNTLVHNGTTWVRNSRIQSFINNYNQSVVDFIYTPTGTKTSVCGDGSNCAVEIYKENNRDNACTSLRNFTSGSSSSGSLIIWSKESQISLLSKEPYATNPAIIFYNGADYSDANIKFRVMPNGEILSKTLSGTTSSLLESTPDGTIQRSTQTIPLTGTDLSLDTTNFDKNLDTTITDVQKLADAVDELSLGGTQIQSDWNQTDNTQVDFIKNKPSGTATVAKMFYFSGDSGTSGLVTIYNTDLGLDSSIDLTTIEILCQYRFEATPDTSFYQDVNLSQGYTYKIYSDRIVFFSGKGTNKRYIITVAINTEAIAEVTGGGSLPIGYENQTLRYNASNELVANSIMMVKDTLEVSEWTPNNVSVSNNRYDSIVKILHSGGSGYDTPVLDVHRESETEPFLTFRLTSEGVIMSSNLQGTGVRPLVALSDGTISTDLSPIRNYIEFLSEPITVISDGYAFSNTQLGLDGINLNDKVKMVQCYVIQADYPNVKNNELVMGHNIEDGQISVRTNFNLAVGDRIKIYIEYID